MNIFVLEVLINSILLSLRLYLNKLLFDEVYKNVEINDFENKVYKKIL